MTRPYTTREFGPGYCRNGHDNERYGKTKEGSCAECNRQTSRNYYNRVTKRKREEARLREEARTRPEELRAKVDADVQAMRARVQAARNGGNVYEPYTMRERANYAARGGA